MREGCGGGHLLECLECCCADLDGWECGRDVYIENKENRFADWERLEGGCGKTTGQLGRKTDGKVGGRFSRRKCACERGKDGIGFTRLDKTGFPGAAGQTF